MAKKDAKEFARAKMYYGEGAGNRRKLIKAKVNERSRDPHYKSEFERYSQQQDMSKHADAAKKERRTNDVKKTAGKTARGIYHLTMRDGANVAASVAVAYGVARATGADKIIASKGKKYASEAFNYVKGQVKWQQILRNARKR